MAPIRDRKDLFPIFSHLQSCLITKARGASDTWKSQGTLLPLPPSQKICKDKCSCSLHASVYSAGQWQHQTHGWGQRWREQSSSCTTQEMEGKKLSILRENQPAVWNYHPWSCRSSAGPCSWDCSCSRSCWLRGEPRAEQQSLGALGFPGGSQRWGQIIRETPGNLLLKGSGSLIIIPKAQSSSRRTPGSLKDLSRLKG